MIAFRYALAALMVVLGFTIIVRMLAMGLHFEELTGLVLGGAMIGLGLHRISLLRRVGEKR
jgi:hypothetical protein